MKYGRLILVAVITYLLPALVLTEDFSHGHWIDLTHEFSEETISHPRGQQFVHTPSVVGMTPGGYYMATYNYSGSEHAGTHLDAPVHFHEGGDSIEQLSLQQLMGDVVVIDVKKQVAADQLYLVTVEDILNWEQLHGRIPDDSIVLFNTGLANVWPDKIKYIGTDQRGNEGAAKVKNPGIHRDAAMFLSTKRQIKLVGLDAPSFDNARQADRRSHRTFFEYGIPGMENVANIDELPATGAYMIALPMKIKGGSAAPVRIIAFVPDAKSASWVTLFAGANLDRFELIGDGNWRIVDDYVESSDGKHGFLVSKDSYRDFELHVEFWPSSDANSGVFLRCQDATAIANETCYELNIMDQHPKPANATGSIINLAAPRQAIKTGNRWNVFDIAARGDHIVIRLNGTIVVDFRDQSFAEGPIGLQGKSGLIRFRNVRVKPLPPEDEF